MSWMDKTLSDFQSELASSAPTPGGGTACAAAGPSFRGAGRCVAALGWFLERQPMAVAGNTAQLAACSCHASTPTKRAVARHALPDAPQHGRHKGAGHCAAHQKGGLWGDQSWGCRFRAILCNTQCWCNGNRDTSPRFWVRGAHGQTLKRSCHGVLCC